MNPTFPLRSGLGLGLALLALPLASQAQGNLFQFGETSLSVAIPDAPGAGITRSHTATGLSTTQPFTLQVSLTLEGTGVGAYNGDYYAYLYHETPGAATSVMAILLNRVGRSGTSPSGYSDSGFDVTFQDSAAANVHTYQFTLGSAPISALTGSWRPDGRTTDPLSVLDTDTPTSTLSQVAAVDPNGSWTLFVADMESGGTGKLTAWGVTAVPISAVPEPSSWMAGLAVLGALAYGGWRRAQVLPTPSTSPDAPAPAVR